MERSDSAVAPIRYRRTPILADQRTSSRSYIGAATIRPPPCQSPPTELSDFGLHAR